MNKLFAYYCPTCGHVLIVAARIVGAAHQTKAGWFRKSQTHDMLAAGEFPATRPLESIRQQVEAMTWRMT